MSNLIQKSIATVESVDDDEFGPDGGFRAVLSTPSLDRDGDRLHRDEWIEPLPERLPLDVDHGMSVSDTIGSFRPYFEGEKMMMEARFSGLPRAQEVRQLIREGHISTVSVAFMTDKSKKDSEPRRELLNAGVVATPSNRDAVILAVKACSALKDALSGRAEGDVPDEVKEAVLEALSVKSPEPYGDVRYADPEDGKYPIDTVAHIRAALAYINVAKNYDALGSHAAHVKSAIEAAARSHGIDVADPHSKSADGAVYVDVLPRVDSEAFKNAIADIWTKAGQTASGVGGDGALVQAIHDASSHLGAACPVIEVTDEGSGADDGANKAAKPQVTMVKEFDGHYGEVHFASVDGAREWCEEQLRALDEHVAETKVDTNTEAFEKALDQVLTPDESAPEAPAPTDEVPAPASPADEKAKRERALQFLQMRSQLLQSL